MNELCSTTKHLSKSWRCREIPDSVYGRLYVNRLGILMYGKARIKQVRNSEGSLKELQKI